jgi:hypothetical protein
MAFEHTRCTKFRGADCDTDHYLVVEKVRERLAVRKQATQKFYGEKFNLRKLNDLEVRKQYKVEITNRFAALENVSDDGDINRAWESIKDNIKTSVKESLGLHEIKQNKPWFDEEFEFCYITHENVTFQCERKRLFKTSSWRWELNE